MSNVSDISRDQYMLKGALAKRGYDWWWHSFSGRSETTGKERTFFLEFYVTNPELGKEEPVFADPKNGVYPSYLMIKAGSWGEGKAQLHRFLGIKKVKIEEGVPFALLASDCYLDEKRSYGKIDVTDASSHPEWLCDNGSMSWDLQIEKKVAFNVGYGASAFFRSLNAFEMYWHAEGMKTLYSGTVIYNGEKYIISPETSYGYADKNWGSDYTSPWLWLSSDNLTSKKTGKKLENSVFDIGGGRPKAFGISLDRKLLGDFYYEGKEYEFNFSKFTSGTHTEFAIKEDEKALFWHVVQYNHEAKMESDISCLKKDMLFVNYVAPDGVQRHKRLFNGGTGEGEVKLYKKRHGTWVLIDDIEARNVGCEYGEYGKEEKTEATK